MIPLYGFVEGDTLGLVILVSESQTVKSVADLLQASASVRVAPAPDSHVQVMHEGRVVAPDATVSSLGMKPLDRVDVVRTGGP